MKASVIAFAGLLIAVMATAGAGTSCAQGLTPGAYHWYAPEHERYGRTTFYSLPSFNSGTVRVTRAQQFRLEGATNGWATLEFDIAGKAYVHLRILRTLVYDPAASDPWYEFRRASVFAEDPAKIEARLKGAQAAPPPVVDSKTPAWKRYKEAWGLKPTRPAAAGSPEEGPTDAAQPAARPVPGATAKPRSKYPLLPPIGSDPASEARESGGDSVDPR